MDDYTYLISLNPDAPARSWSAPARLLKWLSANAYADLEEAVTIKPSYALAYYYMGDLMYRKGETDYAWAPG